MPQTGGAPQHPLHTPPNRRRSAPSLHRAVVLRSAQRALQRERQKREEAQEEDEVEAAVSPERELGGPSALVNDKEEEYGDAGGLDGDVEEPEPHPPVMPSVGVIPTVMPVHRFTVNLVHDQNEDLLRPARRVSVFRASLDVMRKAIPLPFGWKAPEEIPLPDEEGDGDEYDEGDKDDRHKERDDDDHEHPDEGENNGNSITAQYTHTPVRRNLVSADRGFPQKFTNILFSHRWRSGYRVRS